MRRVPQRGGALKRVLQLGGVFLLGVFVFVLATRETPGVKTCVDESYFAHAIEWLAPELLTRDTVTVCSVGPALEESVVPKDLACAVPRAKFANRRKDCTVFYSDLLKLNAYETNRQVEANALRVPQGKLLLQKSQHCRHLHLAEASWPQMPCEPFWPK